MHTRKKCDTPVITDLPTTIRRRDMGLHTKKLANALNDMQKKRESKGEYRGLWAEIQKRTGVYNISRIAKEEIIPGFETWAKLHEGYPDEIPPPTFTSDSKIIVEPSESRTERKPEEFAYEHFADQYRGVPLYESGRLAAKVGGYTFNDSEVPDSTVVVYRPELPGRARHDLRALRVGGDSMHPRVPKGSIVIVDLNDREYVDRKIWVVREPGSDPPIATVKYVQKVENDKFRGFALVSENRQYFPEFTELDWPELVVGRAVWMWRSLEEV